MNIKGALMVAVITYATLAITTRVAMLKSLAGLV